MGQILIRNIDDAVHHRLKAKAAEKGVSLEAYVRGLLLENAKPSKDELLSRLAEIRAMTKHVISAEEGQRIIAESRAELENRHDFLLGIAANDAPE